MRSISDDVNGSVFYTQGPLLHLWHGTKADRKYGVRHMMLKEANFDPLRDISLDPQHCWQWSSDKAELHDKVREYFWARKEESLVTRAAKVAHS